MNREEIEQELGLKLPKNFEIQNIDTQQSMIDYLKSLNQIERKAYSIGIEHLGTSYNMLRSNGYINWLHSK